MLCFQRKSNAKNLSDEKKIYGAKRRQENAAYENSKHVRAHTHTHIKHRILIHSLSLDIKISKQSEIPLIFLDVRLFFLHPLSIPIRCVSRMVLVLWCFALKCQIRFYLDVIWPCIVLLLLPLLLLLLYFLSSFCSARLFAGILI